MKSWKLTLGNSLQALGTSLVGVGVVPQLGGTPSKLLTDIALAGFLFSAAGTFFAHLFVADQAAAVKDIAAQQEVNIAKIDNKQDKIV